jgi:ferredoxin-fold anticodon binding domain-containing protein
LLNEIEALKRILTDYVGVAIIMNNHVHLGHTSDLVIDFDPE